MTKKTIERDHSTSPWKIRRKIIIFTLMFCAFCVSYIMFQAVELAIFHTIVTGCFTLAGSIIGAYVFGATYQDVAIEKLKAKKEKEE